MSPDDPTYHELLIYYRHNHPSAAVATAIERQEYASTTNPIAYSTRYTEIKIWDENNESKQRPSNVGQSMLWSTTGNHEHWIMYTRE